MQNLPIHHFYNSPDARISYWEWGDPHLQTVFLVHATGFHGRVWDQTVKNLNGRYHVIAVDQRGHGHSENKGLLLDWTIPAQDVVKLIEHLDLQNVIGVGHSMGGHALTQACAHMPERFERLVLLDPVIFDPERYAEDQYSPHDDPAMNPVSKRRNEWESWEAFYDRLKDQHPYSLWQQEALKDYCQYGLVPKEDGEGLELACPPLIEASVYTGSPRSKIYDRLSTVTVPVLILRAKEREVFDQNRIDFSLSPTWNKLASCFPTARDVYRPDLSHFIPMQDPELTAQVIMEPDTVF